MAGLALGKPLVTTTGHLTEDDWARSNAVAIAPATSVEELAHEVIRLLSAPAERERLGTRARAWYRARFSIEHTLDVLGVKNGSGKVVPWRSEH